MSDKLIRMYWDCPMCGKKGIISSERRCTCGYVFGTNPDDKFRMPGQDEEIVTVTDADNPDELIENWRCDFCGAYNKSSERKCKTCGHPRDESAKGYYSVTGEKKSTISSEISDGDIYEGSENIYEDMSKSSSEINDIVSGKANAKNLNDAKGEFQKTIEKHRASAPDRNAAANVSGPKEAPKSKNGLKIVGVLVAIAVIAFAVVMVLFSNHKGSFKVTGKTWERSIEVEKQTTVSESGWTLPEGARLDHTASEVRSYNQVVDHYEDVTVTKYRSVPKTETYYEDLGNGNAQQRTRTTYVNEPYTAVERQPIYKNVPVFDTKYYYDIDKYVFDRTVETSGTDNEPVWGDTNLKDGERTGNTKEKYTIKFDDGGKEKSIDTDLEVWKQYKVGDEIALMKNNVGMYSFPK